MLMQGRFHFIAILIFAGFVLAVLIPPALAQTGVEFPGTVLAVDLAAGKLTVKKDDGGTRFTFSINDKTQFAGAGLTALADIKKGDRVIVRYVVTGSQYVAQTVTARGK